MVALLKKVRVRRVPASSIVALTWFDAFVILTFGFACGVVANIGAAIVTLPPPIRETKFEYIRIVDEELTTRALQAAENRCRWGANEKPADSYEGRTVTLPGGYPDAKYKPERAAPSKWDHYSKSNNRRR